MVAQGNTLGVEVVQDSGWKWLQFVMGRLANFDYCFDVEGQRPGLAPAGEVLSGFVQKVPKDTTLPRAVRLNSLRSCVAPVKHAAGNMIFILGARDAYARVGGSSVLFE